MLLALVSEPAWARSIFSHGDRRPLEAAKPAWAARTISRGTMYRIHGTNRPGSMGGAVSHGCFRMHYSASSTYLRRYRSAPMSTWCREFYKVAVSWPPLVLTLWMRARSDLIELVTVLRPTSRNDHASKDLDVTRCARALAAEQRPRV